LQTGPQLKKQMTILHVIASMNPVSGGPCQGLRNSIPELEKFNIHREVVSLDDPAEAFLGNDPFIVHPMGPADNAWGYSAKLYSWLVENLDRFDIIIVNGLWQYHVFAVGRALRRLKRKKKRVPKLYVMPHGMLDPYFQRASHRKLKAIRNWFYWKLVEGPVLNAADGLLFTCEEELRLAREPFRPYKPKRELNVGYGIAAPPQYTGAMHEALISKCPAVRNRPYLLFISRIHNKKGVDILVKAYEQLQVRWKGELPLLVIAGPGIDTPYGNMIKELVHDNGLTSSVIFPGMLSGDAKWGAFYGCEAFVLPSHQENFGIAVAESLACGKPVLISNQVNIWREIEDCDGGFVAQDTLEGTLAILEKWVNLDAAQKFKMSDKARECYEQNFSIGPAALKFIIALGAGI
jgi:glycosyltransferase involved in cell wall biosynthesis